MEASPSSIELQFDLWVWPHLRVDTVYCACATYVPGTANQQNRRDTDFAFKPKHGEKRNKLNLYNTYRRAFKKRSWYKTNRTKSPAHSHSVLSKKKTQPKPPTLHRTVETSGSRIMNLEKLQEYICELSSHTSQCGGQVTLIGEARNGLALILYTSRDALTSIPTLQNPE